MSHPVRQALNCLCASLATLLLLAAPAHAQVYKWVDANGKVTFSDLPPPAGASKVETRSYGSSGTSDATLPYELARAARAYPVTLYTSPNCAPCDEGRSYLKQNGIPFHEKTVVTNDDIARVIAVSGGSQMPVLFVGTTKLIGYNQSSWHENLNYAGYPDSSMLPNNYQFPDPEPAAPPPVAADKAAGTGSDGGSDSRN